MLGSVAIGILITLVAGWGLLKYQKLAGQYSNQQELYKELQYKYLMSEQAKITAQVTLDQQQRGIIQMLQREVIATMSDKQVSDITHALLTYADAVSSPEKMN